MELSHGLMLLFTPVFPGSTSQNDCHEKGLLHVRIRVFTAKSEICSNS